MSAIFQGGDCRTDDQPSSITTTIYSSKSILLREIDQMWLMSASKALFYLMRESNKELFEMWVLYPAPYCDRIHRGRNAWRLLFYQYATKISRDSPGVRILTLTYRKLTSHTRSNGFLCSFILHDSTLNIYHAESMHMDVRIDLRSSQLERRSKSR